MTITSHDVANQVEHSLDGYTDEFDVQGIVRDIVDTYGAVDIDAIESESYREIIARH